LWSGRKVLVTGADGFIGSHLVEHLVRAGADVRAFVFYNAMGSWGWLDHVDPAVQDELDVFAGDIRDPNGVRVALTGCDAVVHLAALIGIPFSYHSPDSYVETNITGTLNVLQAARDLGVQRIIHTSTSEVYGTARSVPIAEEHPLQAQSPYAATKIAADQIALSFHRSFETPVLVLRPFNTYGPRQSARAVLPTIILQIATGQRRLNLGATDPTRDFSYIEDTVEGYAAALASPDVEGRVLNLGSAFEISILDAARTIADVMNAEIEICTDPRRVRPRASEVERLWADNGAACKALEWAPKHGGRDGFRRGIEKTVAWFSEPENLGLYKPDRYHI
jgi:NAD dependent epimerase/dehydratase